MYDSITWEAPQKVESLLNLLGYYEAILAKKDLFSRPGDIKSLKLGLILDLVRTVNIAEELEAKLVSAIISAWDMNSNRNSLEVGKEDIKKMLRSIADIRKSALMTLSNCNPISLMQLDVTIMFALPLIPHDLQNDGIPVIRDLLNLVLEDFAERKETGYPFC
jgi:hypothetical protein